MKIDEKRLREEAEDIIRSAVPGGALSEHASKKLLKLYGVETVEERLFADPAEAGAWAEAAGRPMVVKLCSPDVAHKKERGFVKTGLTGGEAVETAAREMLSRASDVRVEGILVQETVVGERELLAGLSRDPVFGPCVTLGLGGIFAEAFGDVSVRVAPVTEYDVRDMLSSLKSAAVFSNYRGLAAVDEASLARTFIGLGAIGMNHPEAAEIDVNPLIIDGAGKPVAVDALVIISKGGGK